MASTVARLEGRVSQLEVEVRDLKARLEKVQNAPWYRQILGTFANDPVFDEIVRLGQELRQREARSQQRGTEARRNRKDGI